MGVVVVGSANVDLVTNAPRFAEPGETLMATQFEQLFGGKGANQAVAAYHTGLWTSQAGARQTSSLASRLFNPAMVRRHHRRTMRALTGTNFVKYFPRSKGATEERHTHCNVMCMQHARRQTLSVSKTAQSVVAQGGDDRLSLRAA